MGIALFALIMSLNGFVFGVVSLQLVPLLEAAGLAGGRPQCGSPRSRAYGQFAGRLVEIFFGPQSQGDDRGPYRHRCSAAGIADL